MKISILKRFLALIERLIILEILLFFICLLSSFQFITFLPPATSGRFLILSALAIPLTIFVQYLLLCHLDRKLFSGDSLEKLENEEYVLYPDGNLKRKETKSKSLYEQIKHPASQILFNLLFFFFLYKDYQAIVLAAERTNIEFNFSTVHTTIFFAVCLNAFANFCYFRVSNRFLLYCGELFLLALAAGFYPEYARLIN